MTKILVKTFNKLLFIYLFGILTAENNKELALNHFMQGEFLMNQGNYALAILEFQKILLIQKKILLFDLEFSIQLRAK